MRLVNRQGLLDTEPWAYIDIYVYAQISQEKLARMAGNVQAMWLMGWRISRLHEQVSLLFLAAPHDA